jgi:hypothetical protein
MPRVNNEHGAFDAPDGWAVIEGLGAVARPVAELAEPVGVRPSIVLTGDERADGVAMGDYLQAQLASLEKLLCDWRSIDGTTPEAEPGPAVLRHCFQAPDAGWVLQYQAYWFLGVRVAILTATAPAADANAAWETFSQAVASYAPPA